MKKILFATCLNLLYWVPRTYYLFFLPLTEFKMLTNYGYMGASLCVFYLFYFWLVPRFFYRQKFLLFIVMGIMAIAASAVVAYGIANLIGSTIYFGETSVAPKFISQFIQSAAYSTIPAVALRTLVDWYSDFQYRRRLERKNTETELALLKAQINPHFLFNTLNNIDILIEKDAPKASMYLKELSDILRFMLYETPEEKISLSKEVEYIRKYIELQKIRTSNSNYVSFELEGETDNILIAPMLFIPFIENAFKHSIDKKIAHAIEVKLSVSEKDIVFYCSNAYDPATLQTQQKSGLGLELIKNRLKLLYRDNYNLKIDKTDNRFTVNLTLNAH